MHLKGRSVFLVVMITMLASVLITLLVTDQLMQSNEPKPAVVAAASTDKNNYNLSSEELAKLNAVMELIETKYYAKVDREEVFDGAISGMMASLNDPYSV